MNTDRILADTFRSHEHLSPDAESTLDAVNHAIRARHRRRVGGLAAAGAAAAATAVVLGATLVGGQAAGGQRAPTRSVQAGASSPAAAQPVPLPALRITSTGLPAGTRDLGAMFSDRNQWHRFESRTDSLGAVSITVGSDFTSTFPTTNKRGVRHDLTIDGTAAREWSVDDWYFVAVRRPDHHFVTVEVDGGPNQGKGHDGSAAALAAIGRRAAQGLTEDRSEPVRTRFTLTRVPAGFAIREASGPAFTRFTLGRPAPGSHPTLVPNVTVEEFDGTVQDFVNQNTKAPGAEVTLVPEDPTGRVKTYVLNDPPGPLLFVDSIVPGVSVVLTPSAPGVVSSAELHRIADGILIH
jgi:hypothetical protein